MASATRVTSTHTYSGISEINFCLDEEKGLTVTIDTERLHIRSVEAKEEDYTCFAALFGDKEVMCKFATGATRTKEEITDRIKDPWVKRWNGNDPYSALAVFKQDSDDFVGTVVLSHDKPGVSELAYLVMQACWNRGFGKEAVTPIVREYAPATVEEGYLLDGKPLQKVIATARPDNPYSCKILAGLGMQFTGEEEKYGALRHRYAIELKDIGNR